METFLAEVNPSYAESMTTATTLAVETAMKSSKVVHHAFNVLSLCAPQPLSLNIIEDFITSVDKEIQDKEMIRLEIQKCSLLMFERDETDVYIRVHRGVHNSIKTLAAAHSDDKHNEVVSGVIGSFSRFLEKYLERDDDVRYALTNSRLVTHLINLVPELQRYFSQNDISQVRQSSTFNKNHAMDLSRMSEFCYRHREYETSKHFILFAMFIALEIYNAHEHDTALDVANYNDHLGNIHRKINDLSQAKNNHDRALAIRLHKLGPEHVDVASSFSHLGIVHKMLGDLGLAKDYHDRALKIRQKKLGPEHVDVASSFSHLGIVHKMLGDLGLAKDYHDRALKIRQKKLGPEHVDVASSFSDLGIVHKMLGDLGLAKDCHDRALKIRLEKLGPEHVDVASSYSHLGIVLEKLCYLGLAKDYHNHALEIRLKKLGPDHVDVSSSYSHFGSVHKRLGDLTESSKDYLDRALAIRLKKLGSEHVDIASSYFHLGIEDAMLGDVSQVKDYHDGVLAILLKKL